MSDISNDDTPSDVSNEQTVGLLENNKTTEEQEIQMGILPDATPAADEVPEGSKDFKDEETGNTQEERIKSRSKVLSSPYGSLPLSGAYISHYNAKGGGGKFKKKVQQLNSFGIFARKPINDENTPKNVDQASSEGQVYSGNEEKLTPDDNSKSNNSESKGKDKSNETPADNAQTSQSNVKIFNAPSNWSHVKSRLFEPDANTPDTLKTSPNAKTKTKMGIEEEGAQKTSEEKIRNDVKIFNSSSDYSHVKSRLFAANANPKSSPNMRRKSKVGVEDDDELSKTRGSGVKIFNVPSNYSHVKSKLFDADSGRRSSQVSSHDITDVHNKQGNERGQGKENQVSKTSNIKIFNAPSDYSHVRSRLYSNKSKGKAHETSALKTNNVNVSEQDTHNKKASTDV